MDTLPQAPEMHLPEMHLPEMHAVLRPIQIRLARALVEIRERGRLAYCAAATIEELAGRMGFGPEETRTLYLVGYALLVVEETEALLLDGSLDLAAAAELGRVTQDPQLRRELVPGPPDDDAHRLRREHWIRCARRQPIKIFRRMVSRRKAEARHRTPATTLVTTVTLEVEQDIERARKIASRKKRRALTTGETIGEAVNHYLDCFDPMRRKPRTQVLAGMSSGTSSGTSSDALSRTAADTSHDPKRRHIPEAVKRIVRRRADDRCEFPGCTNDIFLEFAHIHAHAAGGTREVHNLLLLCSRHHFQLDARMLTFRGWGSDAGGETGGDSGGDSGSGSDSGSDSGSGQSEGDAYGIEGAVFESAAFNPPVFEDMFGQQFGGEIRGPP